MLKLLLAMSCLALATAGYAATSDTRLSYLSSGLSRHASGALS